MSATFAYIHEPKGIVALRSISKFLKETLADRSLETKIFVKKYLDFVERVHQLMEEKGMNNEN